MTIAATVFVIDDDEAIRRALDRLIRSVGLAVESFASADDFLVSYDPQRPGCLVLDVRMPGPSGLELQDTLAEREITLPIVFISGHGDVPMSVRAMKAGALDFIPKPFSDQVLLDAIHRALQRDTELRQQQSERRAVADRLQILTRRERQVLELVVSGRTNRQIADALGASEKTIKVHRARVMRKMRADSLVELVLLSQVAGVTTSKVPSAKAVH
ncbi:MAG TPA: response regulator transcription factor [Phycisphaerae bacterium]|jgi:RNA polymerase sigma factor (sigma-70 family)